MQPQPLPDEEYERKSWWSRVKDGLLGAEEPEEEEDMIAAPMPAANANIGANQAAARKPQPAPLRLQTARGHRVSVRRNAQVFEDAKLAADGLKGGEQQIVNLERATPQMAERIIDFLNGVCYALDGTVERVGDKGLYVRPGERDGRGRRGGDGSRQRRAPHDDCGYAGVAAPRSVLTALFHLPLLALGKGGARRRAETSDLPCPDLMTQERRDPLPRRAARRCLPPALRAPRPRPASPDSAPPDSAPPAPLESDAPPAYEADIPDEQETPPDMSNDSDVPYDDSEAPVSASPAPAVPAAPVAPAAPRRKEPTASLPATPDVSTGITPRMLSGKRIGIIGAGAMGGALCRGLVSAEAADPKRIIISDPHADHVQSLNASLGVKVADSNSQVAKFTEIIVLAVKPPMVASVLEEISESLKRDGGKPLPLVICIAAGVHLATIESHLREPIPVIRAMPNTPAQVGKGACAYCLGTHADETHAAMAGEIFKAVGVAVEVSESVMDAVTALSGSGPAYVYLMIEALVDGGVKVGLPPRNRLSACGPDRLGRGGDGAGNGNAPGPTPRHGNDSGRHDDSRDCLAGTFRRACRAH